jgi:hypothetical protein
LVKSTKYPPIKEGAIWRKNPKPRFREIIVTKFVCSYATINNRQKRQKSKNKKKKKKLCSGSLAVDDGNLNNGPEIQYA